VYRVNFTRQINGRSVNNGSCPFPLAQAAEDNIDQITSVARYMPTGANFKMANHVFRTSLTVVDRTFMDMFRFNLLEGDKSTIEDHQTVWINDELKEKYWPGQKNVVGKTLSMIDGDLTRDFKVGAVFSKPPRNTSFGAEAYINYKALANINEWDENNYRSWHRDRWKWSRSIGGSCHLSN
jgi:putative ABC transport system permease protein